MIGTIILAGGIGTRLGLGPKALIKVGEKTLLEIQVSKSGDHVIILTSKQTHQPIIDLAKEKGLQHLQFVEMPTMPCYNYPEILKPIGNGALFEAVVNSKAYRKWCEQNITHISIISIDNPLANPLDPELVGGDLVVLGVEKQSPDERLGSIVLKDHTLRVIEYFELKEEERKRYMLGYSGSVVFEKKLFEQAAKVQLPWHEIERNGVKHGEKFLFDAFILAKKPKVVTQKREDCFAPIKIESDIADAERMLYNRLKR